MYCLYNDLMDFYYEWSALYIWIRCIWTHKERRFVEKMYYLRTFLQTVLNDGYLDGIDFHYENDIVIAMYKLCEYTDMALGMHYKF